MKNASSGDILSYNQYAEIEKQGFTTPYIVELQREGQNLLFYGSEHTNNPEHPQFQDVEERWKAFVANSEKPIALVEGRFDEVSQDESKDRTKSIVEGGEAQFVVHLARKDGVEVASPEPDRIWEANELAKEFGRDNVVFYYFVRQVGWWNRFTEKPDVQAEANKMLGLMEKTYNWHDVDFSIERMAAIHEELFGKPLSWDDTQWVYEITTPTPQDYVTNELARRSGELRDEYILEQIMKYWKESKSLFIVFGSAHAIRLEPALRNLAA
ncbi:hypothetical protein IPL85_00835 [Candidatus Saccharibacteria bacterium]|nr:MAG: hypothetical protein IPL85_00835 [Candidatus Saccharibacteria bacterium]